MIAFESESKNSEIQNIILAAFPYSMKTLIFLGAIPFFLLMIGLEVWASHRKRKQLYRLNDAITNLNIGIGNQVFNLFLALLLLGAYNFIFQNLSLIWLPVNLWTGLLCLLGFDFLFYWAHRWSHESNFFWGAHVVHHSSEEYNLSVALRQSWIHNLIAFFIFIPLPLLGFDPAVFFVAGAVHTLYQFWIHTQLIGKLPVWVEAFLNTPSHHRVHHGVNPQYIDKNHGGVFIIWDRLFGTFAEEKEEVVYGITTPLESWNPSWANLHYYVEMVKAARSMKWKDRLKMIFARPGWRPDYLGGSIPIPSEPYTEKFDAAAQKKLTWYVLVNFVMVLLGLCSFMYFFETISWFYRFSFFTMLILSTMICGGIMEQKSWVVPAEHMRLVLLLLSLNSYYFFWSMDWFLVMVIASSLAFLGLNLWFTLGRRPLNPV